MPMNKKKSNYFGPNGEREGEIKIPNQDIEIQSK